jgi:hypothetical protein
MSHNPYSAPESNVELSSDAARAPTGGLGIHFDDLPNGDKWRFAWGFFWRSMCIAILSMLGGAVAGGVIGYVTVAVAQAFGSSLAEVVLLIRILGGVAGLLVGFAALWQLVRWCFSAKWFGYRLRLMKDGA